MTGNDATPNGTLVSNDHDPSVEAVLEKLLVLVRGGIAHGHFEASIAVADAKAGYTKVIIKAGKQFHFVIPKQ